MEYIATVQDVSDIESMLLVYWHHYRWNVRILIIDSLNAMAKYFTPRV